MPWAERLARGWGWKAEPVGELATTVPALLRAVAAERGEHPAVVDDTAGTTLTFAELRVAVDAAAAGFVAAGIEPGDRVAIWAPNCWEWVVALVGLQSAGAVVVPLNTRYKGAEAAQILSASGARILVTVEGFLGNDYVSMLRAAGVPTTVEQIVVLRGAPDGGLVWADFVGAWADFVGAGAGVDPAEIDARVAALGPDDLSDMMFTSGTTGAPKGVMATHGQTVRAFDTWASTVGLRADDRYLVVNPFFHTFGYKAGIVAALITGATIYPVPVFDVDRVLEAVGAHRITVLPGPPTLFHSLLQHPVVQEQGPDATRLSSLRLAVTGAAVVPVQLVRQMSDVLGFETVLTAYGLTEACGVATISGLDADAETVANFSGRAIPGVEVEIHDPDGNVMAPMEPGEVVIRGYNVMKGYFGEPEKTAEAIDADGWLHTGDVGVMDERGYLRITDRLKDMFIAGGFNAYPAEIEALMSDHDAVAQVAVVSVPDDRLGEVGYAFVVPAPGTAPSPAELVEWARGHMANFKAPRHVELVEALPVNPSGKVVKYELRSRALAALTAEQRASS